MKRLHVHVGVKDLDQSIRFYSTLFGTGPSKTERDYAKWMLEDPRVNFAISVGHGSSGVRHLGVQVDSTGELAELGDRLARAGETVAPETNVSCCYAKSDKGWVEDPQGLVWETFFTHGDATTYYGEAADAPTPQSAEACGTGACAPQPVAQVAQPATCCG